MSIKIPETFKWVQVPEYSTDYHLIELDVEPYTGMVIIPNNVDLDKRDNLILEFSYGVVKNPNNVDFKEDEEFHEILQEIFQYLVYENYGV